jgi:anti-anti-sigma factor
MHIAVEENEDKKIVRVDGRLDASSSPHLEHKILSLFSDGCKHLLIDFSKIDYLSSAGMRLLLSITKKLHAKGGMLALCAISDEVMEIIKMAGFERVLNVYLTEQEALAALSMR